MAVTLGSTLKARREELGWSLRDVEKKTRGGISNGYLSLLEADSVKQPSPRHLHMLAEVLNLDYALLIRLAGYEVPKEAKAATAGGWAFSGPETLTPTEQHLVEQLLKEQVKFLTRARAERREESE